MFARTKSITDLQAGMFSVSADIRLVPNACRIFQGDILPGQPVTDPGLMLRVARRFDIIRSDVSRGTGKRRESRRVASLNLSRCARM